MIEMRVVFQQIDFSNFDKPLPLQTRDVFLMYITVDKRITQLVEIPLRRNEVTLQDSYIYLGFNQD